jgi:hypothetical protein
LAQSWNGALKLFNINVGNIILIFPFYPHYDWFWMII